jgi:LacI family transcriptional regulator, galactose operon repressor
MEWLERLRWPAGVTCVRCGHDHVFRIVSKCRSGKPRKIYECGVCHHQFTVITGTIFHNSHLPLKKWTTALRMMLDGDREYSAGALARELEVQYRTARRVAGEVREALRYPPEWLSRALEDENRHTRVRRSSSGLKPFGPSKRPDIDKRPPAKMISRDTGRYSTVKARSTRTIGFVVPDLINPFFTEMASGLMKQARKRGYSVLISSSGGNDACEREEIEEFLDLHVDSLVIVSTQTSTALFQRLKKHGVPFIMVDREIPGLGVNYVGVDDEKVGMLAVSHLYECGCRHIAHIGGPRISTGVGRLKGYLKGLRKFGIPERSEYIANVASPDLKAEFAGYKAMSILLKSRVHIDSVFCYNDVIAIGTMRAIAHAGQRIPGDIAVVGVGNVPNADLFKVPLTSIDQKCALIGERAGEFALSLVENRRVLRPKRILLSPVLVRRQSTRRQP